MGEIAKAIRYTRVGAIVAAFMFVFYLFSVFIWDEEAEKLHLWFITSLIYLFVSWGLIKKYRGVAIFGFSFYVFDNIKEWLPYLSGRAHFSLETMIDGFFSLVVMVALILSIIGTFWYHRLIDMENMQT